MMRTIFLASFFSAFTAWAAVPGNDPVPHDHSHATGPHKAGATANSPILKGEYVENKGQWQKEVLYRADFGVTALFAERDRLTFSKWEDAAPDKIHDRQHGPEETATVLHGHAWYMHFTGAQPSVKVDRIGASNDYFNYFIGNDRSKWASEVRHFNEVRYTELWPGIDLRLYDQNGAFKYDLELDRADQVGQVKFTYEGLIGLASNDKGELQIKTSVGELYESVPVAWYADGAGEAVECAFVVEGNTVGFRLAPGTDPARPVVIDPLLIASTLSGTGNVGTTQNYGHTATYDDLGNIYTGAICFGQGYPTTPGAFDATFGGGGGGGGFGVDIAISKLDATGSNLLYATYLGGDGGDYPHSLVVNMNGEMSVLGTTDSNNYPTFNAFDATFNGGYADIVITKLNPTGTALIGSTYVGTPDSDGRNSLTSNYGDSYRGEILTDAAGKIYISSCTSGTGFPTSPDAYQTTHGGGQDGVVFCLSPGLNAMEWSTYIGTAGNEMCFGIKLNSNGEPYVCGGTSSNAFPTTPGALQTTSAGSDDAFILHFNNNASTLLHSTYFGSSGVDIAFFLQLDLNENVYIYGQAPDALIPIQPVGTYGVAGGGIFVAEFAPDLSSLVFSTTLGPTTGGGGWNAGMVPVAFLVDVCDNIYISGYSVGSDWPITPDALYTSGGFYIAVYQAEMTGLAYGTYYEGAGHVDGGTSRFDANGIVYQAVCTSGAFPTTPTAYSNVQPSGWDIGVFKIDMQQSGVQVYIQTDSFQGCAPATFTFNGSGNAPEYIWDLGDGSASQTGASVTHTYNEVGTYTITLVGLDSATCNFSDTTMISIFVGDGQAPNADFLAEPLSSCSGFGAQFQNTSTPSTSLIWNFGDGETSTADNPFHAYDAPGSYEVWLTIDDAICGGTDSIAIQVVIPTPTMDYDLPSPVYLCNGATTILDAGGGYDTYIWSTGSNAQMITVVEPGQYEVAVSEGFCLGEDTVDVLPAPDVAKLEDVFGCPGLETELMAPFAASNILWSTGSDSTSITVTQTGTYWFTATDQYGCTRLDTVEVEVIPEEDAIAKIPNVFSPNNDGYNDQFQVTGIGLQDFSMEVYNRWGQMVFSSSNPATGWNGGKDNTTDDTPDGTYFYIVTFKDVCSKQPRASHNGHVTLLR